MAFKPDVVQVLPIIEKLEKFINNAEYYPARNSYRGMVVLGLVSKALTVGRAVCSLISSGFPGEAFGMSRTLIDICFTARYISNNDTEERAKRFAEFYSKDHEGWTKIITKFYPQRRLQSRSFTEMHWRWREHTKVPTSGQAWAIKLVKWQWNRTPTSVTQTIKESIANTTTKSFTNGLHFLSIQLFLVLKVISWSLASHFESMQEANWKQNAGKRR